MCVEEGVHLQPHLFLHTSLQVRVISDDDQVSTLGRYLLTSCLSGLTADARYINKYMRNESLNYWYAHGS